MTTNRNMYHHLENPNPDIEFCCWNLFFGFPYI